MLRAALFDFDGTLVDTTDLIYQSMRHSSGEVLGLLRSQAVGAEVPVRLLGAGEPVELTLTVGEYPHHREG